VALRACFLVDDVSQTKPETRLDELVSARLTRAVKARESRRRCDASCRPDLRPLDHAAYRMRRLELARHVRLNPCRSFVPELPVSLMGEASAG
jgi:hypothetical protein